MMNKSLKSHSSWKELSEKIVEDPEKNEPKKWKEWINATTK